MLVVGFTAQNEETTVVTQLERPVQTADLFPAIWQSRSSEERVVRRAAALRQLDAVIAPRLKRLIPAALSLLPYSADLTIYDGILPGRTATGGQWTVAVRRIGWFTHSVWSFTLLLDFDSQDRPACLRIRGRKETATHDLSVEGIERAIDEAAAGGPLETGGAQAFVGISL